MSSKFRSFTTFSTVLWLAMFVEKSVCPNGKPPPQLNPTSGPWMSGTHLGSVGVTVSPPSSPLHLDDVFFGGHRPSPPSSPTPSSNKPSSVPTSDWLPSDVPPYEAKVGHIKQGRDYWPPPSTMPVQSRPWLPSIPASGPSGPWLPSSPVPGPSGVSGPPSLDSVIIRGRPFSPLPSPITGPSKFSPLPSSIPGPSTSSDGPKLSSVILGQRPPQQPPSPIPGPRQPQQPPQPPSPIPGPHQPQQPPQPPSPIPGPHQPPSPTFRPRRQLYPALMILKPRPGQPGSPQNPGTIIPGPTQKWLASVFYKGLLPASLLKRTNEVCSKRTICREGTCCLETSRRRRLCKPLGKRGDRCSAPALAVVYFGYCPCGVHEGNCVDGICR